MKDDGGDGQIIGFVRLSSKLYALELENGKDTKKVKGVKGCVVNGLTFEDYNRYRCTLSCKNHIVRQNGFKSLKHDISTVTTTKIGLSAGDDERLICEDKTHTDTTKRETVSAY